MIKIPKIKIKFIFSLFFILISLVSIIFVALAETNPSVVTDEGTNIRDLPGITLTSIIFVAVTFLLSHYMKDHDEYLHRLRKLEHKCYHKDCKNEETLQNCILCCISRNHFGIIDFTLIDCFIAAILLAALLFIQIQYFSETILMKIIGLFVFLVLVLLLAQLFFYLKQGNTIARWIQKLGEKSKSPDCCEQIENCEQIEKIDNPHKYPSNIFGRKLTDLRILFAKKCRINYKGRNELLNDIFSDLYCYIVFVATIILILSSYFILSHLSLNFISGVPN